MSKWQVNCCWSLTGNGAGSRRRTAKRRELVGRPHFPGLKGRCTAPARATSSACWRRRCAIPSGDFPRAQVALCHKVRFRTARSLTRSVRQKFRVWARTPLICALHIYETFSARALSRREAQTEHGIDCEVVDVRSRVPAPTRKQLAPSRRRIIALQMPRKPRLCGLGRRDRVDCGGRPSSFSHLYGSAGLRITTPHIPTLQRDRQEIASPYLIDIAKTVWCSLGS